jgi:hypothetical protein
LSGQKPSSDGNKEARHAQEIRLEEILDRQAEDSIEQVPQVLIENPVQKNSSCPFSRKEEGSRTASCSPSE